MQSTLLKLVSIFLFVFVGVIDIALCAEGAQTNAEKKILQIVNDGFRPRQMVLTKLDASLFFYNATGEPIDNFRINFGKRRIHCHNPALSLDSDGYLRLRQTLIANSFLITCFPDAGEYAVSASVAGREVNGTVIVRSKGEGE